jgi:hypothetical protein
MSLFGAPRQELDNYDARESAVNLAAWWSGIVAAYVYLKRPVPEPLGALWRWFVDGHWPSGFPYTSKTWRPPGRNWRPDEEPWRNLPPLVVL